MWLLGSGLTLNCLALASEETPYHMRINDVLESCSVPLLGSKLGKGSNYFGCFFIQINLVSLAVQVLLNEQLRISLLVHAIL